MTSEPLVSVLYPTRLSISFLVVARARVQSQHWTGNHGGGEEEEDEDEEATSSKGIPGFWSSVFQRDNKVWPARCAS